MTRKELAQRYRVSGKTLKAWLKRIPDFNPGTARILTPIQIEQIYRHLGQPETIESKYQG